MRPAWLPSSPSEVEPARAGDVDDSEELRLAPGRFRCVLRASAESLVASTSEQCWPPPFFEARTGPRTVTARGLGWPSPGRALVWPCRDSFLRRPPTPETFRESRERDLTPPIARPVGDALRLTKRLQLGVDRFASSPVLCWRGDGAHCIPPPIKTARNRGRRD